MCGCPSGERDGAADGKFTFRQPEVQETLLGWTNLPKIVNDTKVGRSAQTAPIGSK